MCEIPLRGGFVNRVVRVGDTVRREPGDNAGYVHRLLAYFEKHDWAGAPRYLGIDTEGREILEYLGGITAPEESSVRAPENLGRVAGLIRQFHDLTAASTLSGGQDVVCHNDLSPKNTIYFASGSGLVPVAFIDWDLAGPGARIHDLAHMCWQFLRLGPHIKEVTDTGDLMRLICDAYELDDRTTLLDTILWWQERCWRGIQARAASGEPAMIALRDTGISQAIQLAQQWTHNHRHQLASRLN